MPIVVRRKDTFRSQLLAIILLSLLAGLIGGGLVGLATGHGTPSRATSGRTT
jgi:hypothetical protein